jgi:hypothetical protein
MLPLGEEILVILVRSYAGADRDEHGDLARRRSAARLVAVSQQF